MLKCPADVYGHDFSPVALLEKRIHHLQQQSLHPCSGLRDLRIHLNLPVEIDSVIDNVVGSVQLCRSAGYSERQLGEGRYAMLQSNLSLKVRKHGFGIVFVLSSGSGA